FPGVDPLLGPEMRSTGEVMGVGRTFAEAFAKAQLGSNSTMKKLPEYTPQRKERFVRIIHCVIIAVQVLLLVCYSHYQPLMLIYYQ
ncbi:hypothetical protein MJI47_26575, partial [Salmonella enterica subsp. enterica serovar Kentucky]|nr:hypothetical protein [Salmonella enterica subsp. enterica serovar Kentucky]